MRLQAIKKDVGRNLLIYGGLAAVLASIYFGISYFRSNMESEMQRFRRETNAVISSLSNSEQERKNVLNAIKRYDDIPLNKLPTADGYASTASKIRATRPLLEAMKSKYRFTDLDVTFLNVSENETIDKELEPYTLVSNRIMIKFNGMTDELVFSFLDELVDIFPGYITIENFSMSRDREITSEVLNTILQQKRPVPLVSGEIIILWNSIRGENNPLTDTVKPAENAS